MSGLGNLGISRKLAMYTFEWNRVCGDLILDHKTVVFGTRAAIVISLSVDHFLTKIPGSSEILLAN